MEKLEQDIPKTGFPDAPTAGATVLPATADLTDSDELTTKEEEPETPITPRPKRSKLQAIILVAACTGTQILNVSAGAGTSMAMPAMARDLNMSNDKIPWIASAFALSSGCLLVLFGRLADLYGRKLVWQCGTLWFILMNVGCALAKTSVQLIVLRALAGAGPAAMLPATIGILAHAFPPSRARSTAFATFSAGAPLGGALGIVFGGVLTEYATWRGLFYFVIALGVVVYIAGLFTIDKDPHTPNLDKRVDVVGAFLVTTGLVLLTFAMSDASSAGWSSPMIISLLVIGVVLVAGFIGWEYYLIHRTSFPPLMPLDIWKRDNGRFAAIMGVGFCEWGCFMNLTMYAMLYYQNYAGLSPLLTMYRFLPLPVTGLICNVVVALVVGHISGAYLLALGLGATSASAALFAVMDPAAPYWKFGFPAAIICVFGADFAFACGTLFVAKIAKPSEQSLAGALFQTITALGTSVSLSITTVAQTAGMNREARRLGLTVNADAPVQDIPPPVLLQGYRVAQWGGFAFGACGLLIVVVFLHGIGIVGSKKKREPEVNEESEKEKVPA